MSTSFPVTNGYTIRTRTIRTSKEQSKSKYVVKKTQADADKNATLFVSCNEDDEQVIKEVAVEDVLKKRKMDEPYENSSKSGDGGVPNYKKRNNKNNQVHENIQKTFFLEERNPITPNDFLEWKNTMIDWIWSVPEYKDELLKNQDILWGRNKGHMIVNMLGKINLFAPNIKNLDKSLQYVQQFDHIWDIIENKLLGYCRTDTPLPKYHTCEMAPIHQLTMENQTKNYCTKFNPCIIEKGPQILLHYILHYKKKGAWNKQYPEPAENDPRMSYSCLKCSKTFRNNPNKNIYSARGMLIVHLAKDHGEIIDAMKNEKEADMTSVINLLIKYLPNVKIEINTIQDKTRNKNISVIKKTTSSNIDLVHYNDKYNMCNITGKLQLKPMKTFHTCIMLQQVDKYLSQEGNIAEGTEYELEHCTFNNPMKIEIDDNKWNIIEHYSKHYKKQGAWNLLISFPERTKTQQDAYLKNFTAHSMDSMIEGYSCKKCKLEGNFKVWYFKAWSVHEKEKAKNKIIDHLTKYHYFLNYAMKKDTCLDMSSVLSILENTNSSVPDEMEIEDWIELWFSIEDSPSKPSSKRKAVSELPDNKYKCQTMRFKQRLCGQVFSEQELTSYPPTFEQSMTICATTNATASTSGISHVHPQIQSPIPNGTALPKFVFQKASSLNNYAEILCKEENEVKQEIQFDMDENEINTFEQRSAFTNEDILMIKNEVQIEEPESIVEKIKIEPTTVVTVAETALQELCYTKNDVPEKDLPMKQEIKTEIMENETELNISKQHSSFTNEDIKRIKQEVKIEESETH